MIYKTFLFAFFTPSIYLELWTYLKDAVTSDAVVTVDELVEKLVTTVSHIPQPYLKSVVKESIKKQKSLEEGKVTRNYSIRAFQAFTFLLVEIRGVMFT